MTSTQGSTEPFVDTLPAAQAVELLIREYGKLVFHTIYGMTSDWEESQDLTQDTFQQAFKAIDAARAKSGALFQPKAWLLRIAVNTVLMQRRRRSLLRFIPFSRMQKTDEGVVAFAGSTPLDALSERAAALQPAGYGIRESEDLETVVAEQDLVRRVLARLSEPLRVCLVLSIIGQFSGSEIAAMLQLEEATVRQRLTRARKLFQQLYQLESGESLHDPTSDAVSPSRGNEVEDPQRAAYYELHTHATPGRKHAERFHRHPAVTPLR
jgi:RNA polymerase sigma-70 factor (ECF subfamily)